MIATRIEKRKHAFEAIFVNLEGRFYPDILISVQLNGRFRRKTHVLHTRLILYPSCYCTKRSLSHKSNDTRAFPRCVISVLRKIHVSPLSVASR